MSVERFRRARRGASARAIARATCLIAAVVSSGSCRRARPSTSPNAPTATDSGIALGAVPRVVEPAPRAVCTVGEPFALVPGTPGVGALGAWRAPGDTGVTSAAALPGARVGLYRADLSGASEMRPVGEIALPAGAVPTGAWRAHGGGVVIAWSQRGTLHAGRAPEAGGAASELDFVRPAQADGYRERALQPLDDPSDSDAFGIVWAPRSASEPANACAVRLATLALGPCWFDLPEAVAHPPGYALARTLGAGPDGALFVHARRAGLLDAAVVVAGAGTEVDRVGRLGPPGVGRLRRRAEVSRAGAGPVLVKPRGDGLVAWVEADGALRAQSINPRGQARGEPATLPFAEPALIDAAPFDAEAALVVETLADRETTPPTTTLVLLDLSPEHFGRAPVEPVRVPLARPRLLTLSANELLLYAPASARAARVRCGPATSATRAP